MLSRFPLPEGRRGDPSESAHAHTCILYGSYGVSSSRRWRQSPAPRPRPRHFGLVVYQGHARSPSSSLGHGPGRDRRSSTALSVLVPQKGVLRGPQSLHSCRPAHPNSCPASPDRTTEGPESQLDSGWPCPVAGRWGSARESGRLGSRQKDTQKVVCLRSWQVRDPTGGWPRGGRRPEDPSVCHMGAGLGPRRGSPGGRWHQRPRGGRWEGSRRPRGASLRVSPEVQRPRLRAQPMAGRRLGGARR